MGENGSDETPMTTGGTGGLAMTISDRVSGVMSNNPTAAAAVSIVIALFFFLSRAALGWALCALHFCALPLGSLVRPRHVLLLFRGR
jgi:hypothetical protein